MTSWRILLAVFATKLVNPNILRVCLAILEKYEIRRSQLSYFERFVGDVNEIFGVFSYNARKWDTIS